MKTLERVNENIKSSNEVLLRLEKLLRSMSKVIVSVNVVNIITIIVIVWMMTR